MKRLFATLLVLMLAVSGLAMAEEDASVENILEKGTFILGLDDSFPPMGFRDENNDIVGFDIDVAKEVAARLGVEFIAQPGGSIRDDNVIETANKYGIVMAFTGMRLFHH